MRQTRRGTFEQLQPRCVLSANLMSLADEFFVDHPPVEPVSAQGPVDVPAEMADDFSAAAAPPDETNSSDPDLDDLRAIILPAFAPAVDTSPDVAQLSASPSISAPLGDEALLLLANAVAAPSNVPAAPFPDEPVFIPFVSREVFARDTASHRSASHRSASTDRRPSDSRHETQVVSTKDDTGPRRKPNSPDQDTETPAGRASSLRLASEFMHSAESETTSDAPVEESANSPTEAAESKSDDPETGYSD